MLFYKFAGDLVDCSTENEESAKQRDLSRKISIGTTDFNGTGNERFCFVSDADQALTGGIITKELGNPDKLAKEYLSFVGLEIKNLKVSEITLGYLQSLLTHADRQSYVEDDDEILERFELDKIGRRCHGVEFGENLISEERQKADLIASANQYFMKETLLPELERIFEGRRMSQVFGHPVHYIVETDEWETRREVYKIILEALRANQRLDSRRYAYLDFRPNESYSKMAFETLYKACRSGAVVIRYFANDDSEENENASGEREIIENICDMAKRYRDQVLTVICLPRECKKVKAIFYEYLGTMSFVEIREDFIRGEDAKRFLTDLAEQHQLQPDEQLFFDLQLDKSYLSVELRGIFSEWYNDKLKNTIYPQYKDMIVARKEVAKSEPRGSAYDELMEMVGLSEAKAVIRKALNYYKMQMLYAEKGIKRDKPAMHMIFSGNPGTAKTTVARLFARIMRENGLLSKGQMVEVGRGDLVGKFVGWTAQTVQSKFKAAIGGVLFIDEAYSLVDDRDGSFGDEAINTIVQEMENHRADVVVIFAGYPDKMEGFLQKNPGLRSRIAFHVPFADYDSGELCQIARLISQKNGMHLNEEALDKLAVAFDLAKRERDFGNGRYVRNVFEQARMNQACRLIEQGVDSITTEEVKTITAADIIIPTEKRTEKQRIGFC